MTSYLNGFKRLSDLKHCRRKCSKNKKDHDDIYYRCSYYIILVYVIAAWSMISADNAWDVTIYITHSTTSWSDLLHDLWVKKCSYVCYTRLNYCNFVYVKTVTVQLFSYIICIIPKISKISYWNCTLLFCYRYTVIYTNCGFPLNYVTYYFVTI